MRSFRPQPENSPNRLDKAANTYPPLADQPVAYQLLPTAPSRPCTLAGCPESLPHKLGGGFGCFLTPCRAGPCLHERLLRKHIPDSDPGCVLQSTSMPALHRRNLPNCRPMAEGGKRKCSAVEDFARRGDCPPLGSGWGAAESTVPIRCTKPQLRVFTPWCAGNSRHERLL